MADTIVVSGKTLRALRVNEWANETFILENSAAYTNNKFSKDRKFMKARLTINGANLTGSGGFTNNSIIAIDSIILRERADRVNIVDVNFNNFKDDVMNNFDNLSDGNRYNPYYGLETEIGRSVAVCPPISGKNYITMWRAGFPIGDFPHMNNLVWTVPQWLNHGRSGGSPPAPGFSSIVVHDAGVTLDGLPATAGAEGVYEDHYNMATSSSYLALGLESVTEGMTKRIKVLSTGQTYSGALLEVQASGNITSPSHPWGVRAIVLSDYQKPIIVPKGIEMIASCLIKTIGITSNNQTKNTDKYMNGAGFTISQIDTSAVVGTGVGMGQVSETYMAGGLTGVNDWTYCSIRFTTTETIVNFRLWLKDEAGEAWFGDLKLAAVDTMKDASINRQQTIDDSTQTFLRTSTEGLLKNPKMFLHGSESVFAEPNPTLGNIFEKTGPSHPNHSGAAGILNSFLFTVSGPGWPTSRDPTGLSSVFNASRDKTIVTPRLRLTDDFNRESTMLLLTSGDADSSNFFGCITKPGVNVVVVTGWIFGAWHYLDSNYDSTSQASGNILYRHGWGDSVGGSISSESLSASTEHDKWLYHEIESEFWVGPHFFTPPLVFGEYTVGVPQPIDPAGSGATWINGMFTQDIQRTKAKYNEIDIRSGWNIIDTQEKGYVVMDKQERLAYYNYRENAITKISSRAMGRIGLEQPVTLGKSTGYKLNIIYKNQPHGIQNIINKSEAFDDTTNWGSFTKWTMAATGGSLLSSQYDPLAGANATTFHFNPGSGSYSLSGLVATPYDMDTTTTGRQFVASVWYRHTGSIGNTNLVLTNEVSSETAIYDSINLVGATNIWNNYTIVKTFQSGTDTLKFDITSQDGAGASYIYHLYGCHIYETDGSLTDGNYMDANFLKTYVRTSQVGVGVPQHVPSGLYYQILTSGGGITKYLQSNLSTWSTSDYKHWLPKSSGAVNNLDFDFESDTRSNVTHYIRVATINNPVPEASWLYNINIYPIADDVIDKNNPYSLATTYRKPDNRRVINASVLSEIRTCDGLIIETSGGSLNSGKTSMKSNWEFTNVTLDESPGFLRRIKSKFDSPDEYEYLLDNVKFGNSKKITQNNVGNQTIGPDNKVTIFSRGGGISNIDDIVEINESNLLSDVSLNWGKDNSFNNVLIYGNEYEIGRTPKHVISITSVDKKGRNTNVSFEEFSKISYVNAQQMPIIFDGLLQARLGNRKSDFRITKPLVLNDYSSRNTNAQLFGTIYPTQDVLHPDKPSQQGDGIMFKEGLKRFFSMRIRNPDFVDTVSGAAATNWNYNGITAPGSVSYEEQKFGPSSLKATLSGASRYVYQTIEWHPTALGAVSMTAWFKAPAGAYGGLSAYNTSTNVELTARKEGNGEWQRIKLQFHRRAALGPVDANGVSLNNALAEIGSIPNTWQLRVWASATLPNGMSQGTGVIYYDGINVVEGKPLFNITDATIGAAGLVIDWEPDEEWALRTEKDDSGFVFARLAGYGMDSTHKNAARYIDQSSINEFGFKKTQEFEIKFLSSLTKAILIARSKVKDNSVGILSVDINAIPLFFLDPQQIIKLNDPNSGIVDEYYMIVDINSSISGKSGSSKIKLKRVG